MKKRLVNTIRIIAVSLLGLVLLLSLWQTAARVLFHQNPPYLFGYAQLTVLSGSMEPAFSAGDIVVIHKETEYAVGDIIAFQDEGVLTTHRIQENSPEGFITKGDFNNVPDMRVVPTGQVAGKVVLVIPKLGQALLFLHTPGGMIVILLSGLLLLFLPERWRKLKDRRKGGAS